MELEGEKGREEERHRETKVEREREEVPRERERGREGEGREGYEEGGIERKIDMERESIFFGGEIERQKRSDEGR